MLTPVLLVEDDHDLRDFLQRALPYYAPVVVTTAADGISGLEALVQVQPACIILDVKMPGLDGFQVARTIRGDPATAHIPLIILTALTQDHQRFTGLASGADRFLEKPVTPKILAQVIQEVLGVTTNERQQRFERLAEEDVPNA